MSKELHEVKVIKLSGTNDGVISIGTIDEPYGEGSEKVASIAISLGGDKSNPDWKVHIPMNNLDEVIEVLQTLR